MSVQKKTHRERAVKVLAVQAIRDALCQFQKMLENNTDSIRFDTIDRLAKALDVPVSDLFVQVSDEKASDE